MEELAETIGRYCNLLEDAKEEQDWDLVQEVIDRLDDLYQELDRNSFTDFESE